MSWNFLWNLSIKKIREKVVERNILMGILLEPVVY